MRQAPPRTKAQSAAALKAAAEKAAEFESDPIWQPNPDLRAKQGGRSAPVSSGSSGRGSSNAAVAAPAASAAVEVVEAKAAGKKEKRAKRAAEAAIVAAAAATEDGSGSDGNGFEVVDEDWHVVANPRKMPAKKEVPVAVE